MAACESTTLYPLHRCKILHLVRHGQGYHNARELQDTKASLSYDYFDASLTTLGWQQIETDEDVLWQPEVREKEEEVAARGRDFLNCFTNCELRSVVIADSSAIGTHLATTDLSGQVPLAPDVSSEDIDMLENGNTSAS